MTAIGSVFTPDGFVVGADGRRKDLNGRIGCDSTTKIFFFDTRNTRGAFMWAGCTQMAELNSNLDFKQESYSILDEVKAEDFGSLSELITRLSLRLFHWLNDWIHKSNGRFEYPDNAEWARLQIVGYVDGSPGVARSVFPFKDGMPGNPGLVVSPSLDRNLSVFSGNKMVYIRMRESSRLHECINLNEAKLLVHDYIEECASSPADESNTIGGHIHLAAVTARESTWLIPPLDRKASPELRRVGHPACRLI